MRVALIATYEMGRQPFGLASPAAWLERAGAHVTCCDLSCQPLPVEAVRAADWVAFYVPMHTATRLAVAALPSVRAVNSRARLCFYGLYALVNEAYLRTLGVDAVLGGEFEAELTELVTGSGAIRSTGLSPLPRLEFLPPRRAGLPPLNQYAHVVLPGGGHRVAGYTEASRGCKHLCRHCPIVPVYEGAFRVVQPEVVLADVRQQVAAGARHMTFGDPDFFNGPAHAMRVVEGLHHEFPHLSYDVTIKIEHLLQCADLVPRLRDTGCLFVTSAVESLEDAILNRLQKGHTRADFVRAVHLMREVNLPLQPTFVAFTPWTTLAAYAELLRCIAELDLVSSVPPIQLAIRLLISPGSRLLELAEVRSLVEPFDVAGLVHPWRHPDPRVDALQNEVVGIVQSGERLKRGREGTFERIWEAAQRAATTGHALPHLPVLASRAAIPYLNEPWYC